MEESEETDPSIVQGSIIRGRNYVETGMARNNDDSGQNEALYETGLQNIVQIPFEISKGVAFAVVDEIGALTSDMMQDLQVLPNTIRNNTRAAPVLWPEEDLYRLISRSLLASISIYALTDFRKLIRKGLVDESDLTLPLSGLVYLRWFMRHEVEIKKLGSVDTDFYYSAAMTLAMDLVEAAGSMRKSIVQSMHHVPSTIVVVDDESSCELVYSIGVDTRFVLDTHTPLLVQTLDLTCLFFHSDRRIVLTFRGSVTVRDFIADGDPFQYSLKDPTWIPNADGREKSAWIGVHRGFHDYLFKKVTRSDGTSATKFDIILGHLRSLLDEHEGFYVLVSGHSLGGALATLFSFYAACEDWVPAIYCISFASPRIGNIQLSRSFQKLECEGRILHLRVVNNRDPVPLLPNRLYLCTAVCPTIMFRHVGIELRLYGKTSATMKSFYCPRFHNSYLRQVVSDFLVATRRTVTRLVGCIIVLLFWWSPAVNAAIRMHSCQEYMDRILRASEDLASLTMRDVVKKFYGDEIAAKIKNV
jgi:hypothetical protein